MRNETRMVALASLVVSDALVTALRGWAREWEALKGVEVARYQIVDAVAHDAWQGKGRRLAERLQRELGSAYSIEHRL